MNPDALMAALEHLDWLRLDLLLRLLLAAVLGGAIGLEREASGKPAGFRTNLLICVGAALLTDLSVLISRMADPLETNADPARIAAQIVSGIGFLGAGTIIQARGSVIGLTTAATLWVVAAIGMAVGGGAYIEAIGTTVLVIIALILLGRVEEHFTREPPERTLQITLAADPSLPERIVGALRGAGFRVSTLDIEKRTDSYVLVIRASDRGRPAGELIGPLLEMPGVRRVVPQ
ncbi:MAG: MgtC/SapB family protein [Gemmatimonadota bacterium]